jgi:hypothetical protein
MPIQPFGLDYRRKVAAWAYAQKDATDPEPYWLSALGPRALGRPPHWCGAFALAALKAAGLATYVHWEIGEGFLLQALGYRAITDYPLPGDIAYFHRAQHHAIVGDTDVDGGMVELIQGNGEGRKVTVTRHLSTPRAPNAPDRYFSIQAFIDRVRAERPAS